MFIVTMLIAPVTAWAAPFAALVMDARTGEVLYAENADTRLHPASLTKMMTLYVTFQAIERGEISLDTMVTISAHAAAQAPSKLGVKPGQRIALRYLIRAAAIKSANDAATAIAEAVGGSEPAFARRMTRTAKSLGMKNSTFKNANGLTASGHMVTARDMTVLGRHLFYDFPQYYNIFSRRTADAGIAQVASTNRRFLDSYQGADGIKTGYTVPAGFNLTASAQRGQKRIIATILGGKSTAWRNQKMAELLDLGFAKAPDRATVQKPAVPGAVPDAPTDEPMLLADAAQAGDDAVAVAIANDMATADSADADMDDAANGPPAAKTVRVALAVTQSARPTARPVAGAASAGPSETDAGQAGAMAANVTEDAADAEEMQMAEVGPGADLPEAPDGLDPISAPQTAGSAQDVAKADPLPPTGPIFAQTAPLQPETLAALAPVAGTPAANVDATTQGDGTSASKAAAPLTLADASLSSTSDKAPPAGLLAAPVSGDRTVASAESLGLDIDAAVIEAIADDVSGVPGTGPAATRPQARPMRPGEVAVAAANGTSASITLADAGTPVPAADLVAPSVPTTPPPPAREVSEPAAQPPEIILAASDSTPAAEALPEVVTRMSTSGGRQWGINIGRYPSRYEAERMLIQTALVEVTTLNDGLRKVVGRGGGYDANFMGLTEDSAELACRRLQARASDCSVIQPTG